jgi:hypothetical protein
MLAPGRLKLSMIPNFSGSTPDENTMGVVAVASLAASNEGPPPLETSTVTRRATSSAAIAGRRW